MNDDALLRQQLQPHLDQLDWSAGISKEMLLELLVADPPAQALLARTLAGGIYFSPADVLAALPADAGGEIAAPPAPPPQASPPQAPTGADMKRGDAAAATLDAPFASAASGEESPGPVSERTTTAVAILLGVLAVAGVVAWLGRRLLRK